MFRSSANLSN